VNNKDWTALAKTFSENWILGKRLRTFYNEKNEIVHCEDASINRDDVLKNIKRLQAKDLNPEKTKKQKSNKSKDRRNEIKKLKKSIKKPDNR
tara:strand:- start:163 stop:438 length:276 start_codon:yes stop_codon:yes gene_type:complete